MALNSVNTNLGAMVALQSLNRTSDALDTTQKRISTGMKVSDAKDDGAAFAVAQRVRADVSGLEAANSAMGGVKGLLDVTNSQLKNVTDTMAKVKDVLTHMADTSLSPETFAQYSAQYTSLSTQITDYLADASYNGRALLGGTDMAVIRNESAGVIDLVATATAGLQIEAVADAAAAATSLATGGDFVTVLGALSDASNTYGNLSKRIDNQITANKEKLDAMESGLGALVDADLAKESAKLQSLQIRQQLGTTALSSANQAPQMLLSLFQ
jgi:flagellin